MNNDMDEKLAKLRASQESSQDFLQAPNFDPGFHETMKRRLKWDTSLKNRKPYRILTNSSEMRDLIAEMLVKGATKEELDRAIEHSARVIDTERSEKENNILELKRKYMKNHEAGDEK